MVVLSRTSRFFNRFVGPLLLRGGLSARYFLGRGVIKDNPLLDTFLLLPLAQKLVSLEVHADAVEEIKRVKKEPSWSDKKADEIFDSIFGKDPVKEEDNKNNDRKLNPRLKILEKYLRVVLVPNERWSDVEPWIFNTRFLKWARAEFLMSKYGDDLRESMKKHPKLRHGPLVSPHNRAKKSLFSFLYGSATKSTSFSDTKMVLPSTKQVIKAFGMESWTRKKDVDAKWKRMSEIAETLEGDVYQIPGTNVRIADLSPETSMSSLSLEEILELAGGHVSFCGMFNALMEECDIYEFWTKEFVHELAAYLLDRSNEFNGETYVLDIGAGDGLLSQCLRENLDLETERRLTRTGPGKIKKGSDRRQKLKIPKVIAIDDGSWNIIPKAPVEKLTVDSALANYKTRANNSILLDENPNRQIIALCSWMPHRIDWTSKFRKWEIDEYILIGECDDGNCGDNYYTWGNIDFLPDDATLASPESNTSRNENGLRRIDLTKTPYEVDGYERADLKNISCHQFSRFDSSSSSNSKTISFRRREWALSK